MKRTTAYYYDPASEGWLPAETTMDSRDKVAILQLGRYGDIISILPVARMLANIYEVHAYVDVKFMDLFEAISYVFLHPMNLGTDQPHIAEKFVQADGQYERIIFSQVHGNRYPCSIVPDNFIIHQWALAGAEWLSKFHNNTEELFDRRDSVGEAEALSRVGKLDGRPLLLLNFEGSSSPYDYAKETRAWVNETLGEDYQVFDLSKLAPSKDTANPNPLSVDKFHHLLGILSKATALLTIDTASLHLAGCIDLPTIQLSSGRKCEVRGTKYFDSEARSHVVFKCSYEESILPAYRNRMATILKNKEFERGQFTRGISWDDFPRSNGKKIHHVVNWYYTEGEAASRMFRARATWESLRVDKNYNLILHTIGPEERSSYIDLGDDRKLPYVRDILDYASSQASSDDEILVISNADVCLVPEALHGIRLNLLNAPCCFSRRVEVSDSGPRLRVADLKKEYLAGADLFACTVSWWNANRSILPDLLLGAEAWDTVYRWWMLQCNPLSEMQPPVIYHERHVPFWSMRENISTNPAQVYNRKLSREWLLSHGATNAVNNPDKFFALKPDQQWMNEPILAL